jgi:hypothetical protein
MLAPNNPGLLAGLPPGPPGLKERNVYVKSIRVGNQDVLDTGVVVPPGAADLKMEIVLGGNAAAIEGRVVDSDNAPVDGAVVGLVPATVSARGFRMDMYKSTASDPSGGYQIQGLPPGAYKVFAWEDFDTNALVDQDLIRFYEGRGAEVQIDEGGRVSLDLQVIPAAGTD